MLAQAAGFALLAGISPAALLVMAVFLGSDNPRRTALLYFAGAALMTVIMAVTVLLVLRATGMNQPEQHAPRYGLRLGLGILALAAAVVMTLRARRTRPAAAADQARKRKPSLMSRLTARPRPATAFLAGMLLFVPSAAFVAAVQVIATANATVAATVAAMLIVIALTAAFVWLPLVGYLAAPAATTRALRNANGWLAAHGRTLVVCGLAVVGVILVVNGALNL